MKTEPRLTAAQLSSMPLHCWPATSLLEYSKNAARLWKNRPEFSGNWSLFCDREELASELVARVLARLKKERPRPDVDQVTFFYQVAEYCRFEIEKIGRAPMIVQSSREDDDGEPYDLLDSISCESNDDNEEFVDEVREFFKKVGVGESDFALFLTPQKDFEDAAGLSERHIRDMKTARRREIANKIKKANLVATFKKIAPRACDFSAG